MTRSPPTQRGSLSIALVVDEYASYEDDAVGIVPRAIARKLSDRGHQVTVFTPSLSMSGTRTIDTLPIHYFPHPLGPWNSATNPGGSGIYQFMSNSIRKASDLATTFRRPGVVRQYARPGTFDVVHGIGSSGAVWFSRMFAQECQVSYVATPLGFDERFFNPGSKRRAFEIWLNNASLVCVPNHGSARLMQAQFDCRPVVVPCGPLVSPSGAASSKNQPSRVLNLGPWSTESGSSYLVHAIPLILPEHPFTLVFAGDGELAISLRALAQQMGVAADVEFIQRPSLSQLREELASCEVVVQTNVSLAKKSSRYDGFGFTEAFAYGKPVVGTTASDPHRLLIHGENGWQVPAKDPRALANGISDLLRDRGRATRFGGVGNALVRARLEWGLIIQRFEACYVQAIARQIQRNGESKRKHAK